MDRRHFLQSGLAVMAGGISWRLWAAPAGGSNARLMVVFLRGAYDALSMLVPHGEPFYYESRPTIAIPRPDPANPLAALPLDSRWALHPGLADSAFRRFASGQLAFVPFAGTDFVSRSHFQAQDWIESGQPAGSSMSVASGFLNRLVTQLNRRQTSVMPAIQGVSFTDGLPIMMRGESRVANAPVHSRKAQTIGESEENLVLAMYAGHPLRELVEEGIGLRREISRELSEEMQAASRSALPASGFALEAGRVARLMRDRKNYSVAFIDVGGWDTHVNQGGAQGALANRLNNLGAGLEAIAESMGNEWSKTTVVVLSEFGRTFRENGSRGTDHGHGSAMWVLGGAVRGGALRGEQAALTERALHQGRDMPVLNDYRTVLAGVLRRMYGLGADDLGLVFPSAVPVDLGLL